MHYDYLIIGQGLAGSCMALQLLQADKKILVIDNPHPNTSSMVAAGIFNPITGRKMVKTWKADQLFPYLKTFYSQAEKELKSKFFHQLNIYRPFIDTEVQNEWMGKSASEEHRSYVDKVHLNTNFPDDLFDQYGGLELKNAGYVDLPAFINSVRLLLKKKGCYLENKFDEDQLIIENESVTYASITSKKVIICNGDQSAKSKLFGWLPFSLVKGEILEIAVPKLPAVIYNRGVFILPKGDNICRVGATYDQNDLTLEATDKGKRALIEKLNGVYRSKYHVVNQVAGIRPASKDRRPFIGIHPKYPTVGIFNGLGAKGVSLAPYFSRQFVELLENNVELDNEVDINRYKSIYYNNID
jgi:glycine/D-amino acid oxidase-like deaminating enzyme